MQWGKTKMLLGPQAAEGDFEAARNKLIEAVIEYSQTKGLVSYRCWFATYTAICCGQAEPRKECSWINGGLLP